MKVEFIIINGLGTFPLEISDLEEEEIKNLVLWFKRGSLTNFSGNQSAPWLSGTVRHNVIFPAEILKQSILKWRIIED